MSHLYIGQTEADFDFVVNDEWICEFAKEDDRASQRKAAWIVWRFLRMQMLTPFLHRLARYFLEYACENCEELKNTILENPKIAHLTKAPG